MLFSLDNIYVFLYNQDDQTGKGKQKVTIQQKIKMALAYKGMSEAELSRQIGTSPSAFNQRMKTGKFTGEELKKIAEVLGAEYYCGFRFEDGTEI